MDRALKTRQLAMNHSGARLNVEYFVRPGPGRTLLYLHGLGCSKSDFAEAARQRSLDRYTLMALDFPGCGGTAYPPDAEYGMDDLAAITGLFIERLSLEAPVLVGHSMGGLVALLYAHEHPDRVAGLVNVEGNLAAEDCFVSQGISEQDPTYFQTIGLPDMIADLDASGNPGFRRLAATLRSGSDPRAMHDYAPSLVRHSKSGRLLPYFVAARMPKLFVYGSQNQGLSYIPWLAQNRVPTAKIPKSDHFPGYDNPAVFYPTLAHFLKDI
ncbi:MAG: alpha/beta hydrolase [Elusimicrobiota bacterium]|jgi:pimeloyl-ACP methyl ester carboxylesterase